MNTLTKEWLQNTITGIESIIDDKSFVCSEIAFEIGQVNNILTAFKIALASLAAVSDERAAYELFMEKRFGESVDRRRAKNGDREYMAWDMALGWIIWCHRAAMLQAEPVSNSDELPLDYLQGHKDGLEWAAQLAEANHPQTGDWLYDDPIDLARAIRKGPDMPTVQGGNSPVTPDAWISCSARMPAQDDWILIYSKHGEYMAGQVQGEYVELSDGTLSWLGNALFWMMRRAINALYLVR